jgi:hypothetical protein
MLEKDMKLSRFLNDRVAAVVGLIWGFPPVRNLTGALSFLKKGTKRERGQSWVSSRSSFDMQIAAFAFSSDA